MSIALVITNLAGGGAERTMLRLAVALAGRGHDVRLILLEHLVAHEVPASVRLHALTRPGRRIRKGLIGIRLAAFRLRALYRRLGLDRACTTISMLPFTDRVVAAARLPNVWFAVQNTLSVAAGSLAPPRRARRLARYRRTYEGRNLVAVSGGVEHDLRVAIGLERARIVRIYNGVDAGAILASSQERDPGIPAGPFIVHAGRFAAQKRHDLLLDAFAMADIPHRLVLLTDPHPDLVAMISSRGLERRVTIAGFKQNPFPWIRAAELLVLCSDHEGMPNVLLEALACGTRVVSTDCPSGPRELLGDGANGRLVPCGDAGALAAAMRSALASPRPPAGTVPERFTEATMAAAYEALAAES
jgi:glycosyltransferase involved in cell wall biosynthesis